MSTINTSVQLAAPPWVTARALGAYLMTFQGGMALGSILWGYHRRAHPDPNRALFAPPASACSSLFPWSTRFRILQGPLPDFTPHQFKRPAPELIGVEPAGPDDPQATGHTSLTEGPVRISVEYRIPLDCYAEFTHRIHELRGVRLRDGAVRWGIYRDADDPTHLNETFIMESWLDYLRSRERVTAATTPSAAASSTCTKATQLRASPIKSTPAR